MLEAGEAQDLGHLRHVAEHVGEVADPHRRVAAQRSGAGEAALQVADDGLARDHELVHEDHPRPDLEPSRRRQCGEARRRLRAHLQVVVDHRGLPVEQEPGERRVALEQLEQIVDEVDELHPVGLERGVPLPVPMRVGDDRDISHSLRIRRQKLDRFVLQFVHIYARNGKPPFLNVL